MTDRIDPATADIRDLRAMPYLMDAINASLGRGSTLPRFIGWQHGINALTQAHSLCGALGPMQAVARRVCDEAFALAIEEACCRDEVTFTRGVMWGLACECLLEGCEIG